MSLANSTFSLALSNCFSSISTPRKQASWEEGEREDGRERMVDRCIDGRTLGKIASAIDCSPTRCSCAASTRMVPTPHIGSTTVEPGWRCVCVCVGKRVECVRVKESVGVGADERILSDIVNNFHDDSVTPGNSEEM